MLGIPSSGQPEAELRLRTGVPDLVALPWLEALSAWSPAEIPFRDIPVGPSRHLVRFVHVGGRLWALKELLGSADQGGDENNVVVRLHMRHPTAPCCCSPAPFRSEM